MARLSWQSEAAQRRWQNSWLEGIRKYTRSEAGGGGRALCRGDRIGERARGRTDGS